MPSKKKAETWGHYIHRTQGDAAYHQYRKNYDRVLRYKNKLKAGKIESDYFSTGREAANMTLHPDAQMSEILEQTYRVTDPLRVKQTEYSVKFRKFMEAHNTEKVVINDKKVTLDEVLSGFDNGDYSASDFIDAVNQIKSTPEYIISGSP